MGVISTKVHGITDYVIGIVLIVAPFVLGFADGSPAQWVPIVIGVLMLGSSVMTNYELALVHVIPMPMHLGLDMLAGIVLIASPWIFHFSDRVYLPHVILGVLEVGVAAMTRSHSSLETAPGRSTGSMV